MKRLILPQEYIHRGCLVLINAQYPYREEKGERRWENVCFQGKSFLLQQQAAVCLTRLMNAVYGWRNITAVSSLRSTEEQKEIYAQSLRDNGIPFTRKYVALPGHSEHQSGLAIDLALNQEPVDFIRPSFPYEGICQAFRQRAADYGFVERYPEGKEDITGISHEPWHFRFVGSPHAEIMKAYGFVLEEYVSFLREHRYGENPFIFLSKGFTAAVSYLETDSKEIAFEIDSGYPYQISGNNADGLIITQWRK